MGSSGLLCPHTPSPSKDNQIQIKWLEKCPAMGQASWMEDQNLDVLHTGKPKIKMKISYHNHCEMEAPNQASWMEDQHLNGLHTAKPTVKMKGNVQHKGQSTRNFQWRKHHHQQ